MRRRGVGLDRFRLAEVERAVDERPLVQIVPVHEGDRDSGLARAPGAAGAVQVGVFVVRDGVVDHMGDVVDVDASGRDIRCNEDVFLAGLERGHGALALLLVQVAMHGGRVEAAVVELFDQFGCCPLGASEDDGLAAAIGLQNAGDDLVFVHIVCAVDDVLDVRLGEALIRVGGPDVDGLVHEAAGKGHDRARHGSREQHGVAGGRGLCEQFFDIGEEPEVEHLVGLVEHHHLDVFQRQHPLAGEVEEAAGGADNDLRAGLKLLDLAFVRLAAVDGSNLGASVRCGQGEVFGNLHAQLAGGNDDEGFDARLRVGTERLQQGQPKAEGLAGARLRLADDVLPGETHRNCLGLDRERRQDALGCKCIHHVLVDIQVGESAGDQRQVRGNSGF